MVVVVVAVAVQSWMLMAANPQQQRVVMRMMVVRGWQQPAVQHVAGITLVSTLLTARHTSPSEAADGQTRVEPVERERRHTIHTPMTVSKK